MFLEKAVRQAPEQLPADVMRAAAAAGFGAYEMTWMPQFAWKMFIGLFVGLLCLLGGASALIEEALSTGQWWQVVHENSIDVFAVAAGAVTAWLLFDPRQMRLRVFGFAGGLVRRDRRGRLTAVGWDDIAHVRRYIGSRGTRWFTVEPSEGRAWSVRSNALPLECVVAISKLVERKLTALRLPEAEARIARGERVDFAGITLDAAGITCGSTVPWSKVQGLADDFGSVRIRTAGRWWTLIGGEIHAIPDVYLLVALARRLARR